MAGFSPLKRKELSEQPGRRAANTRLTVHRHGGRSRNAREWVTVLTVLAFFLQSLAVQTHIHTSLPQSVAKAAAQQTPAPTPLKNQDPIDQCRLCQELIHAGSFVTPSAAVSLASFNFVVAV